MSSKIVVIGSSNIDLIMQVEHLPRPGETVTQGIFSQVLGGKGANQAVAAARAGGAVALIASVGNDSFAEDMLKSFQKDGIDTQYTVKNPKIPTGTALITIDKQGENCISVAPGANHALDSSHIRSAKSLLAAADLIVLQCELHPDTLAFAIDYCASLGKKILLNLAPAIPVDDSLLAKLHMLIVNETEAEFLLKQSLEDFGGPQQAAQALRNRTNGVIITLGTKGSYVSTVEFEGHVEAYEVDALDTTAAGDTYCGNLATALSSGIQMEEAVKRASAAAAISVTRLGAQSSVPFHQDIEDFLHIN